MRKYLYLAMVAASALVLASPAAEAGAAAVHVLTVAKAGGTAVKPGAVLKAGLVKGTAAVFTLSSEKLTCKTAAFTAKVTSNPAAPGKARESLTAQTFAKCGVNVAHVTVTSVTAGNLPYGVTVSDSKGDPVKVSGRSKSKPLKVTVKIMAGPAVVTCSYGAASVTGHFSNKGNAVSFSRQKFTKSSGGSLCLPAAFFSATFGPVRDVSIKGSPKVFVN